MPTEESTTDLLERLQESEQLVSDFQQGLQNIQDTIHGLQNAIALYKRNVPSYGKQDSFSNQSKAGGTKKDISQMTWCPGKDAPEGMYRGTVAVHNNTIYFGLGGSHKVYSYQLIEGEEKWSQISAENPNSNFGLAIIDGLLTSVGGKNKVPIKNLLCLTGEHDRKHWFEVFPPMSVARFNTVCVTTHDALIVAGGDVASSFFAQPDNTVEVLNLEDMQWNTVFPLPIKCRTLSAAVSGDTLYLAGGETGRHKSLSSVLACSVPDLLPPTKLGTKLKRKLSPIQDVWKEIRSLPVTQSTLVSFCGDLIAIGGNTDSGKPTSQVFKYDSQSNSWTIISELKRHRSLCLAVSLQEESLLVIGGVAHGLLRDDKMKSVELLN